MRAQPYSFGSPSPDSRSPHISLDITPYLEPSPDSLLQERLSASESLRDSVLLLLPRDPLS